MTKFEVQQKVAYYRKKLEEYQAILDDMEKVFDIDDFNKPFRKYSINDLQALLDISEKAYEWSREEENKDATIYDYNLQACAAERIILAK